MRKTKEKKNPWRPPKYDDISVFEKKIEDYFAFCDQNTIKKQHVTGKGEIIIVETPEPYTMAGLAHHLNISRETLNNYQNESLVTDASFSKEEKQQFRDIIMRARERIERQNITHAIVGCHDSKIAALNLASNYGYVIRRDDKQEQSGEVRLKVIYDEPKTPETEED